MLEIEEDVPEDHRLTLVGPGWSRAERVRRGLLTALLAGVAIGLASLGLADIELLILFPLGLLMIAGVAGTQPEEVKRIELRAGELRAVLRGRWIWGSRRLAVQHAQLARVSITAHDVGPLGPTRAELGLELLLDGRRVPSVSIRGVERYDEVVAIAHRMAQALALGVRSSRPQYGLTCLVDRDGVAPPPPVRIAPDGYRGPPRGAQLDLSERATYLPGAAPPSLADTAHDVLLTPTRHDGSEWRIGGERPYAKAFGCALLVSGPLVAAAVFAVEPVALRVLAMSMLGLPLLWFAAPRLAQVWVAPARWLLGLRTAAFPRSPVVALFAGGALPDGGGVLLRRGFSLVPAREAASVFLVRRVPPRKTQRGQRPLGACWAEVWIHDEARWSLLAKGRAQEPPIAPALEAIAHEAARRLNTPVRFSQQRG
ncbi:MAG: hypothetical protein AB8I08_17285 [Sandaracinaceae bacterium]